MLVGEPGSYRLLRSVDAIEVPATVKALLAARIDRLRPEEKSVLQAAAVIGTDVPFEILQAIADIPSEELRRRLAQLQSAEFLYEIRIFPDLEYTFKHALTHEVAYGSLLSDRRRALHGRIVEAIERLYADRLDEQIERLAHHALRSEVPRKAAPYLYEAGARARTVANGEAVTYLRQGLDLAAKLPRDRDQMRLELRLLLALGQASSRCRASAPPRSRARTCAHVSCASRSGSRWISSRRSGDCGSIPWEATRDSTRDAVSWRNS